MIAGGFPAETTVVDALPHGLSTDPGSVSTMKGTCAASGAEWRDPADRSRADVDDQLIAAAGLPTPTGEPIAHWSPRTEVRIGFPRRRQVE